MEYKWKVVKATVDQPDRMKFFYSDNRLFDYLEKVLESYEDLGYYDYTGGNLEKMIKDAIIVGNEKIEADGTGIRDIIKLN
jgi:hypothetical protein